MYHRAVPVARAPEFMRTSLYRYSPARAVMLICALAEVGCGPSFVSDTIPAEGSDIIITPIHHGSVMVEFGGRVLHVDPWSEGNYRGVKAGDWILVTDIHADHLDPELIEDLRTDETIVVIPEAAAERVPGGTIMSNGQRLELESIRLEAIPMYNHERGPEPGQLFHEKGRGNGYVVTMGGKRIYFSGDTACTEEMKALEDIDIAFITMNLPFTMPPGGSRRVYACLQAQGRLPLPLPGTGRRAVPPGGRDRPVESSQAAAVVPGFVRAHGNACALALEMSATGPASARARLLATR